MFETLLKKYQERKWEIILLVAIIATGIFFRVYNFSDWLLFEIDQSYDTLIVSQAVENGIENLPLLGPTAGGGRALRLGPAFYYMEYVSALIFGDTPTGHAMLVLILSILAIPLFYFFIRRYFRLDIAIALTALFSVSAYLILYGRFSWSPNVLPFLILLSFYALLRSVAETEARRDRWFLLATLAITIASQIHFNTFFTIPTITVLFLLYKRPKFHWKTWVIAIGIVLAIYSPMVLSDISTKGENIGFFTKKMSKTNESPLSLLANFPKKFMTDLNYTASGYFLIDSGIDHINGKRVRDYGLQNNEHLPWRIFAILLFLTQCSILLWNIWREKISDRKDFLILLFLWIGIPFVYFYSLISSSFQIFPRFFLPFAPIGIILLGLLLEKILPEKNLMRRITLSILMLTFILPNLSRIQTHFSSLDNPKKNTSVIETDDIFPNNNRLTLEEQVAITDYLLEKQSQNGYPIYFDAIHEYEPVFWYHLSKRGVPYSNHVNEHHLYVEGNYFHIQYSTHGIGRKLRESFSIFDKKNFGILTVYTLRPKQQNITSLRQLPEEKKYLEQTIQIQALTTWKNILK